MKETLMELENLNSMFLKLFTAEELYKKGIKETNFEWKYNFKNINLIPVLELYNKDKVYKKIEAIEFSKELQELLVDAQLLFKLTDEPIYFKTEDELMELVEEVKANCDECNIKDICPFRED